VAGLTLALWIVSKLGIVGILVFLLVALPVMFVFWMVFPNVTREMYDAVRERLVDPLLFSPEKAERLNRERAVRAQEYERWQESHAHVKEARVRAVERRREQKRVERANRPPMTAQQETNWLLALIAFLMMFGNNNHRR
jgi:ABC-type multidrug transport system fused ATPase/permease subunit